jgi:hypothetical protein
MDAGKHQVLQVSQIQLDRTNPRIARILDIYEGEPTAEQIYLALGAGADDAEGQLGTTFNRLKQSILTNGGIIQPIIVSAQPGGALTCVEGNTRLAIYKSFAEDNVKGSWDFIPAVVYECLSEEDVDAIRLQTHLVGPRPWDPYSKAKYLHYLRNREHMPFSKLVDYCGGSQKMVKESIDAFTEMEKYYRPLLQDESEFDPRRFSGFVELQKPGIKASILQAGFTFEDFAKWIHERKIDKLAEVRWLPLILKDSKAREVFLKQGAAQANATLERPDVSKTLKDAGLVHLARAFSYSIRTVRYSDVREFKSDPSSEAVQSLRDAHEALTDFLGSFDE